MAEWRAKKSPLSAGREERNRFLFLAFPGVVQSSFCLNASCHAVHDSDSRLIVLH